jgi:hypothetical protein
VDSGREAIRVGLEPTAGAISELGEKRMLLHKPEGRGPVNVVGYGGPVVAGEVLSVSGSDTGSGAAQCTGEASDEWYFPAGSSALGYDEKLLIQNPFSDEAVVSVVFYTPGGQRTKANLADVAVPSNSHIIVSVNKFILRQRFLGALVTANRGRVVAWRALLAAPDERPSGVSLSLGSPAAGQEWFLPEGGLGSPFDQRIEILNPTEREAIVAISLSTSEETVQPPGLLELSVPAKSLRSLPLEEILRGRSKTLGPISATVRSTNGVSVVVESSTWYTGPTKGLASEIGARTTAEEWSLPPASLDPSTDTIVLMNPGVQPATIEISFLHRTEPPTSPDRLAALELGPGGRTRVPVSSYTAGRPLVARVSSSTPIVAARFSYTAATADVALVLGNVI